VSKVVLNRPSVLPVVGELHRGHLMPEPRSSSPGTARRRAARRERYRRMLL